MEVQRERAWRGCGAGGSNPIVLAGGACACAVGEVVGEYPDAKLAGLYVGWLGVRDGRGIGFNVH